MTHQQVLGLGLSFTSNELKSAYRCRARETHPDTGGSREEFITVQAAWEALKGQCCLSVKGQTCVSDGTPLAELGLGLGPTVNAVDCCTCKGVGYLSHTDSGERNAHPCVACFLGRFRQRSGKTVDCRECHGKGYIPAAKVDSTTTHTRCWGCAGVGETQIYNPVIPKGRLSSGG